MNSRSASFVLLFLLLIYTSNYVDRHLAVGLAEPIKRHFALSDSFLGFLLGPAFAILFSIASIPLARLADRKSRVAIIAGGCAVWSLFTALSGLASDKTTFALMRVGVGIGEAAFAAPAFALIGDYFPVRRRALAIAILGTGSYLGQLLGLTLGPMIAASHGWQAAFIWTGIAGFLIAPIFYLTVAETARPHLMKRTGELPLVGLFPALRSILAVSTYRLLVLGGAGGSFSGYAFGMWGPTYLTRVVGMPMSRASLAFGLAFGGCAMLGALLAGWLCDRLRARSLAAPLLLSAGTMFLTAMAILLACLVTDPSFAIGLTIIAGFFNGGWTVGLINTIQDQAAASVRATAIAMFSLIVTFIGLVGGPGLVGLLSDQMQWFGTQSLRYALIPVTSAGFGGALLIILAGRALHRSPRSSKI